ncbi:MAG TPA: FHA domain-containing protein [Polyangiaceae bacterium]|nr:FHA domain-containing protein [Polyangiaceae bacterium]
MTTCGRCGLQNRADLRFCADCGARLEDPSPPAPGRGAPGLDRRGSPTGVSRAPQRPGAATFESAGADPSRPRCVHCGAPNDPAGRFCTACGRSLNGSDEGPAVGGRKDVVTCQRCHGTNTAGQPYCQFCGARLLEQAAAPARQADDGRRDALPAGEPPARLVVIAQDGTPGTEYPIQGAQAEIGREDGAIRLPTDPYVSPRHLLISRRNGRFFVRDLESVNGVYVRLRAPEVLRHADLVLIGLEVLRFELVSDAERGLGPATERGTRVFGSPSVPRHARLCQLTVEGVSRDVYYLSRDETVIGREAGDLVFTNDPFMSRRHVSVDRDPGNGTFTLRDLGSSNGTFLAIRGERELVSGDHLRVGQHLFRLDVGRGRG